MKKPLFILAALALCLSSARADLAPSHVEALEKMFTAIKLDEQYEASLIAGFESGIGLNEDQVKAMPAAQQQKFKNALTKVQAKMMSTMGWTAMKGEMIKTYAKVFSEKEALEIATFMSSPTGQMFVSKQVTLTRDVMQMNQDKMKVLGPEISRIIQEEMTK